MNIKKVFIIVPSPSDHSPVKGAAALANSLSQFVSVTFVTLKCGRSDFDLLNNSIATVSLAEHSWSNKLKYLRQLLKEAGHPKNIATISSSFSADFINSFCNKYATTCASVRGNNPKNYLDTYGFVGILLAYVHLKRLKKVKHVVSMTHSMAEQVERYIGRSTPVIGNFIDEARIIKYQKNKVISKTVRFIFTGNFIERKKPLLLINAMEVLHLQGISFVLDMFGDGPLLHEAKQMVRRLDLESYVVFHGHVNEPYQYISKADILILPSLSEGVPRSVLEALCLGVPCILRDVDGNRELVQSGVNGEVFSSDTELPNLILQVVKQSKDGVFYNKNLIPDIFRQSSCTISYLKLISQ